MLAVVSVLRTSLVAVPALSRVEPASTSGPGAGATSTSATPRSDRDGSDEHVGDAAERSGRVADHENRAAAARPRHAERRAHERRHAARRDPDDHVALARPGPKPPDRVPCVVLGALAGAEDRRAPAGHHGLDE